MFASVFYRGRVSPPAGGEFLFGRPKRNQKAARGPFRWTLRAHIHGPLDPRLRGPPMRELGGQRKGAGGRRLASGLSPLPLRVRQPLGISPPGGERAFGVGGAQVRLSEAAHPETFRDFRRRVTLGRPRFLGFSHVFTPLQGRPLRSPVEIRIAVPKSTLIRRLRGHLPPRGRFRGAPGFTPGALARKLRRRPKTASKTNFAHSGPQWGRMETQASTPDFACRK